MKARPIIPRIPLPEKKWKDKLKYGLPHTLTIKEYRAEKQAIDKAVEACGYEKTEDEKNVWLKKC